MEYIKVKDLVKIAKGKKVELLEEHHENSIRYIQIDDLRNDNHIKYCANKDSYIIVNRNDIIIAWDGANAGTIGFGLEGAIGSTLARLRIDSSEMSADFCGIFLRSKSSYLREKCAGATIPHIQKVVLEDIRIPKFNIYKQHKIVESLKLAQSLINKRKAQIEDLDKFIQNVFLEMFGDPVRNDKNLKRIKLNEVADWKSGGTPLRSIVEYYHGDVPWLSSGELNQIYTLTSNEKITIDAIKNSSAKLILKGSLLLGMYDTAALKSTINMVDCTCNQAIAFGKIEDSRCNTLFVYHCIQIGKEYYKSQQRGVRQKNLNLSMIKDLEILYPPLDLQNKFAQIVQKTEQQKSLLQQSLTELEDNFNSLMQRAFKGELFN